MLLTLCLSYCKQVKFQEETESNRIPPPSDPFRVWKSPKVGGVKPAVFVPESYDTNRFLIVGQPFQTYHNLVKSGSIRLPEFAWNQPSWKCHAREYVASQIYGIREWH